MENIINDELEASSSDDETEITLIIMKLNLTMKDIRINLMDLLLKVKKVF